MAINKYTKNSLWFFSERALKVLLNLMVGVFAARTLGPSDFGLYSIILGVLSILLVISKFGLESPMIQRLSSDEDHQVEYMNAAICILTVFSIFTFTISSVIAVTLFDLFEGIEWIILLVVFCGPFSIIEYYFHAILMSSRIVAVKNSIFVMGSIGKIMICYFDLGIEPLIVISLLELVVCYLTITLIFFKERIVSEITWNSDTSNIKGILRSSLPLFFVSVMIVVYTKVDQFMLAFLAGNAQVGIYSVAVRFYEAWMLVIVTISVSLIPPMVSKYDRSREQYEKYLLSLFTALIWLSILVSISFLSIGSYLIRFLFGDAFNDAYVACCILIFASVFSAMGSVTSRHFTVTETENQIVTRVFVGLVVNIVLNFFLIPIYGTVGAAFSTLTALMISNFFYDFFSGSDRFLFFIKFRALIAPYRKLSFLSGKSSE